MTKSSSDSPAVVASLASSNSTRWLDIWWPTLAFVGSLLAARLVFLIGFDPFTLIEDEAHYWEWSRRLDWSYYSKGPGVAWAIAASTAIFGTDEWTVRLPAALASAIGSIACAGLGWDIFKDRRAVLLSAVAYQCMPGVFVTGLIMTIDGPYLACWALAAWAGWKALTTGSRLAWPGLGIALAAGFIFKYTIILLPLGLLMFALLRRKHLRTAGPAWIMGGGVCALLGIVPIVLWNWQHDWVTVRHLLGHVGLPGGDVAATNGVNGSWSYNPMWTLEFFGLQFGAAGAIFPLVVLGFINKKKAAARGVAGWSAAGPAYLFCAAVPIVMFYSVVTLFTRVEANWAMAAFVSLAPAAAWTALDGFCRSDRPIRIVCWISLAIFAAMVCGAPLLSVLARQEHVPSALNRLRPITVLVDNAARLGERVRQETGLEPVYIAIHYGRASQLAFYLPGRPTVYAGSAHFGGGRRTQYDVWPETDLSNPEVTASLLGRPGILFGGNVRDWSRFFGRVEDVGPLPGEPKKDRSVLVGYDYRGPPEDRTP